MTPDYEQREFEQQELLHNIIMELHRLHEHAHLSGFALTAIVILSQLVTAANVPPAPAPRPPISTMLDRIAKFARTDAERRHLLARLLTQIVNSISVDVSREHMVEVLRT